jgi:glucose/arabinose dehydrogenase/mono/diheme cytochrome c family protein
MAAGVNPGVLYLLISAASWVQAGDKKGEEQPALPSTIKVPPSPVVPPEKALDTFRVAPGFRLELVASEPLVEDPVAMAFDPDGRIWVVEMRGYMPDVDGAGEEARVGQVAVLEDADGDGRMDKRTTFLERLVLPRAIALVGDGVLVAEPPSLWFCRDRDGDLKCDERTIVVPNYANVKVVEHTANGLLRAIDNWIYSANSTVRLRREGDRWVQGSTRTRGQWGISQDDEGRLFYNTNPEFLRGDLVPSWSPRAHSARDPATNRLLLEDQSTWPVRPSTGVNRGYRPGTLREDGTLAVAMSACGPAVYRGDQFPPEFRGNVFSGDPSGNLVKRLVLSEEGGVLRARNAYEKAEFIASTDERFRPVNLATGPDGCLYVLDFYRGIIQHKLYMTSFLRKEILSRGLDKPIGLGRIYRVVHSSRPPGKAPRLSKATPAELVGHLSHPNGWWRDTAQRLLVERPDPRVLPELRRLAVSGPHPIARLHALFALEGLRQAEPSMLDALSADPDLRMRAAAAAVREGSDPLGTLVHAAAANPDVPEPALAGKELDFLERLMAIEEWEKEQPGRAALLVRLGARIASAGKPAQVAELLDLAAGQSTYALWRQRALVEGMASARRKVELPQRSEAIYKLAFAEDPKVAARGAELHALVSWPDKPAGVVPPKPPPRLTADEEARWTRGRRQYLASCVACHQLSGVGEEGKGPPLVDSEWVTGSEGRLVRIVLHGVQGSLEVKGKRHAFNQEMPGITNMSSEEVAEVLTYIRREWGHLAAPVDPETVKRIRRETQAREEPWTEKELLQIP